MIEHQELERLAELLAARVRRKHGQRPTLHIVGAVSPTDERLQARMSAVADLRRMSAEHGAAIEDLIAKTCSNAMVARPEDLKLDDFASLYADAVIEEWCISEGWTREEFDRGHRFG